MKRFFIENTILAGVYLLLFVVATSVVSAAPIERPVVNQAQRVLNEGQRTLRTATNTAERQTRAVSNMQERALRLIDNRITHLQNLLTKINSDKNLSDSEKSALANEINSLTANLSNLKAKVGSTTSTQELQSIIRETVKLNVYGFYVQKIRLTIIIRELTALTEKISNLAANLQNLVNQEKAQGKDVTLLQNSLDDIQKRLGTIRSMLTADSAKLASATPENARSIFPVIRADLAKVRAEFAQIRADLARMRKDFRTIRNAASPKTSSPSSTISP